MPAGGARLVGGGGGGGADARHVVTCPWKAAPGAARVAPAAAGLPQKGERLAAAVGASARGRFVWATRATARVTAGMHQSQPRRRPSPCPCPWPVARARARPALDPAVPCPGHASVRAVTRVHLTDRSPVTAGLRFRFTGPVAPVTDRNRSNSNLNSKKLSSIGSPVYRPVRPVYRSV